MIDNKVLLLLLSLLLLLLLLLGEGDEKGKIMGIFRSLGALARAIGPLISCSGNNNNNNINKR